MTQIIDKQREEQVVIYRKLLTGMMVDFWLFFGSVMDNVGENGGSIDIERYIIVVMTVHGDRNGCDNRKNSDEMKG